MTQKNRRLRNVRNGILSVLTALAGCAGIFCLLPRKLATEATADNINTMKLKEKARLAQIAKEKAQAEENAKKLGAVQAIIHAKAGAGGKLFGAVTSQEISDALREQFGIEIEKNKIVQAEPIKTFGAYTVKAKLGYEVSGTINVLVVEG